MMRRPSFIFSFKLISVALIVYFACSALFMLTDYKQNLFYFYRLERGTVDVLNLGSSHCDSSINTVKIYRDLGITSYNLSGPSQPIWVTYHYLVEGLKYQKPKLVVLDCYTAKNSEYDKDDNYIYTNLVAMRLSPNKYKAIKATRDIADFWEIFFGFPKTHEKYGGVNREDFNLTPASYYCGYSPRTGDVEETIEGFETSLAIKDEMKIPEKSEIYLRKIIELCREEGIDIVMVNAPWPKNDENSQKMFNYVGSIAKEYGIDFINGCLMFDELGIDIASDFEGTHLNYSGAEKWTNYLESILTERYSLPDHRGEGENEWERASVLLDKNYTLNY